MHTNDDGTLFIGSCEACLFFDERGTDHQPGTGWCRNRAPSVHVTPRAPQMMDQEPTAWWPVVSASDWCGFWQEATRRADRMRPLGPAGGSPSAATSGVVELDPMTIDMNDAVALLRAIGYPAELDLDIGYAVIDLNGRTARSVTIVEGRVDLLALAKTAMQCLPPGRPDPSLSDLVISPEAASRIIAAAPLFSPSSFFREMLASDRVMTARGENNAAELLVLLLRHLFGSPSAAGTTEEAHHG